MYYYVYDEFIQDQKYEREIALIETRLTDLGISGKIARLALFRDPAELIKDEIRRGAKTIVAVGNDLTLRKIIDAVDNLQVTIAIIPVGNNDQSIANILGVPIGVSACDVLSARIVEDLDVGVVNGERFLNEMKVETGIVTKIKCNGKFDLFPKRNAEVYVRNLALAENNIPATNPSDGLVELIIKMRQRGWFGKKGGEVSIVPISRATIEYGSPVKIIVDGEQFESDVFEVGVLEGRLRIVIGKERKF